MVGEIQRGRLLEKVRALVPEAKLAVRNMTLHRPSGVIAGECLRKRKWKNC